MGFTSTGGFALEHFGALGEYRNLDGNAAIDASGTFSFTDGPVAFTNAIDFSDALARSTQVHRCFADHLVQYATGRDTLPSDAVVVGQLADRSVAGDAARDLLIALLESDLVRFPLAITESE